MPRNILVVHKFCDENVIESLKAIVTYVLQKWDVTVLLELRTIAELRKDDRFVSVLERYMVDISPALEERIRTVPPVECLCHTPLKPSEQVIPQTNYNSEQINGKSLIKVFDGSESPNVDLVVCLGGDGTLLNISSMFQNVVPPVIAFRLGSLGFLTPFPFRNFTSQMEVVMEGTPNCLLRMRLCSQIIRSADSNSSSYNRNLSNESSEVSGSRENSPDTEYHFLNELVIDRGLSPFLCDLMVKVNGRKVTHFEGDGLIVSTPTGSTAYSMATGASLLHPWVPAFLLTPINSLALSSRAIVLPMNVRLEISITPGARCKSAHFSSDGKSRESKLIHEGDSILITTSPYPMPCLCGLDQGADWFCSLNHLLNWNTRLRQRSANCRHEESTMDGDT